MRLVTMTKDLRPYRAGDPAVLSDELAAELIAADPPYAKDSRPYPPPDIAPDPATLGIELPPKRGYFTRKRA